MYRGAAGVAAMIVSRRASESGDGSGDATLHRDLAGGMAAVAGRRTARRLAGSGIPPVGLAAVGIARVATRRRSDGAATVGDQPGLPAAGRVAVRL